MLALVDWTLSWRTEARFCTQTAEAFLIGLLGSFALVLAVLVGKFFFSAGFGCWFCFPFLKDLSCFFSEVLHLSRDLEDDDSFLLQFGSISSEL